MASRRSRSQRNRFATLCAKNWRRTQKANNRFERSRGRVFGEPRRGSMIWINQLRWPATPPPRRSTSSLGDHVNRNPHAAPTAKVSDITTAEGAVREAINRGWALTAFLILV